MVKTKKLTTPPDGFGDKNKWADYIEILCMSSLDKIIALDDVFDRLFGDKSDDESEDTSLLDELDDELFELAPKTKSEKEDIRKGKLNDIFNFLQRRKELFKDFYPFQISNSPRHIKINERLSNKNYSYLGLLISSNLDYLRMHKTHLTTSFENNSLFVFKKMLPQEAKIEYFGKGNERSGIFTENKFYDRLLQLSKVLKTPISSLLDEEEINSSNTGDGGLDLVGWYNIGDEQSGKVVIFGQCACGLDWYDKQFEIHPARWNNFITSSHPILRTLLTPISFRNYNGDWDKNYKIYDCIIIDRYRFLNSLRKKENSKVASSNYSIVEEVIKWEIDYFS